MSSKSPYLMQIVILWNLILYYNIPCGFISLALMYGTVTTRKVRRLERSGYLVRKSDDEP
jgi:hypothetical protein